MFQPEHLIRIRKPLGLTQEEMAGFIGLSKRAYSDLETGKTPIRGVHMLAAQMVALNSAIRNHDRSHIPEHIQKDVDELARLVTT